MILAILSFLVFAWFIAGYLGVSQNLRGASVFITLTSILGALFLIPETNSFSIIMGGWAPWATISLIFCITFLFRLFINSLRNKSNDACLDDVLPLLGDNSGCSDACGDARMHQRKQQQAEYLKVVP